jgi:hypothetical protein
MLLRFDNDIIPIYLFGSVKYDVEMDSLPKQTAVQREKLQCPQLGKKLASCLVWFIELPA